MHAVPPFVKRSEIPGGPTTTDWSDPHDARALARTILDAWARVGVKAEVAVVPISAGERRRTHCSVRLVYPRGGMPRRMALRRPAA